VIQITEVSGAGGVEEGIMGKYAIPGCTKFVSSVEEEGKFTLPTVKEAVASTKLKYEERPFNHTHFDLPIVVGIMGTSTMTFCGRAVGGPRSVIVGVCDCNHDIQKF
jgi:hypothetical protein